MPKNKNKNLPHLFNEVLDSIAILKESKGSSEKSILNQVDTILHLRRQHLKKSIASIHRALRHGLKTGLLKLKNGKYCLGMSQADYNIYRKVQKLRSTDNLYKEFRARRGKRRGRRSRRRRGRRRNMSDEVDYREEDSEDEEITSNQSSAESIEPVDRSRRRRGRRGGRRRAKRRRGRRRAEGINEKTDETPDQSQQNPIVTPKTSNESIKTNDQNKGDEDDNKSKNSSDNQKSDNNDGNESDHISLPNSTDPEKKCDKPDCLCNFQKNYDRKSYD